MTIYDILPQTSARGTTFRRYRFGILEETFFHSMCEDETIRAVKVRSASDGETMILRYAVNSGVDSEKDEQLVRDYIAKNYVPY